MYYHHVAYIPTVVVKLILKFGWVFDSTIYQNEPKVLRAVLSTDKITSASYCYNRVRIHDFVGTKPRDTIVVQSNILSNIAVILDAFT